MEKLDVTKEFVILGYGPATMETIQNPEDIKSIIKHWTITCPVCKERIMGDNWQSVVYNPKEEDSPVQILFFCYDKRCATKWNPRKE